MSSAADLRPKLNQAFRRCVMGRWEGEEMERLCRARRARVEVDDEDDGAREAAVFVAEG
jgi:hypothetical protein